MDDTVGAKLKELLTPSSRDELLNDPRRLAELVRERLGTDRRREASFLNTVMQDGVPKRLLTMPTASLTSAMIANYAKMVSEDTGLREDLARSAIEAWSVGLGVRASAGKPPSDFALKQGSYQKADTPKAEKHPEVVSGRYGFGHQRIRLIEIVMAVAGAAAFLFWIGDYYPQRTPAVGNIVPPSPGSIGDIRQNEAAQAWERIQNTASVAILEEFIKQFGSTVYGSMARARLAELKKQIATLPPAAAPASGPTNNAVINPLQPIPSPTPEFDFSSPIPKFNFSPPTPEFNFKQVR